MRDPGADAALPLFPVDHTFVVALRRDSDPARGEFAGRVEHLSSGRAISFATLDGLIEFMRCATTAGTSEAG